MTGVHAEASSPPTRTVVVPIEQIYRAEAPVLIAIAIPGFVEATRSTSGVSVFALALVLVSGSGLRRWLARRQGHLRELPLGISVEPVAKTVLRCIAQDLYLVVLLIMGAWASYPGGAAAGIALGLLLANILNWTRTVQLQKDVGRIYLSVQRRDWLPLGRTVDFAWIGRPPEPDSPHAGGASNSRT